ncbi:hypothetical protein GQ42DRAFT_129321, partial [Ramicandelaber brevisporus]
MVSYVPAVALGLILNLLDALSYGLIIFPVTEPVFSTFGPDGLSMFLLSTAVAQLVYAAGGSAFRGANGSMMIEIMPFLHSMARTVMAEVASASEGGVADPRAIVATTMAAYVFSSIVTGIGFLLLGWFGLGALVGFFPRHILVGCIGGIGCFLVRTAVEATTQLPLSLEWAALSALLEPHILALWGSSLVVALVLRVLSRFTSHPLFVPSFFLAVPALFYAICLGVLGLSVSDLRGAGWLFPLPSADIPFYDFYMQFDFSRTHWSAVLKTLPTAIGLTFFGILHVPLMVPALAASTKADSVDMDGELLGHGVSNLLSGMFGSVQNYMVYSNSILFIRSGGDSRLAGAMLGFATLAVFFAGAQVIGFVPVVVVGALIFHLGFELMVEALVDTVGAVTRIEYITIVLIVVAMAALGFLEGIFLGLLLACVFFVISYAQRSAIRASFTCESVRSTVRRVYRQRRFLSRVGSSIHAVQLQGFLFFGTIVGVEDHILELVTQPHQQQVRFLVVDLALVTGMDLSAAEVFARLKRVLRSRDVYFVLCGIPFGSPMWQQLVANGVWPDHSHIKLFGTLNHGLEWCENTLIQALYTPHLPA